MTGPARVVTIPSTAAIRVILVLRMLDLLLGRPGRRLVDERA
jgi:hypothetical protein